MDKQQLRDALGAAVTDAPTPLAAADRLCAACVQHRRTLDELQFT